MLNYNKSRIKRYEELVREIVNGSISCEKFSGQILTENNKTFLEKARERFRFTNEYDWKTLCSCLDSLGDTEIAILDFYNRLNKTESYRAGGFGYLELYGMLCAVYSQMRSVEWLGKQFKSSTTEEFNKLDIILLRHKIIAHHLNYSEPESQDILNRVRCYRIDRQSLGNYKQLKIIDDHNELYSYDLVKAINDYRRASCKDLELTIMKMIELVFATEENRRKCFLKELEVHKQNSILDFEV